MSVFDLFRGFFGGPGGRYRGDDRRDPFFDGLTHDDDDDDDDEVEDRFHHDYMDRFDDVFRFGFSFGPNGMRIQEPQLFGQIFRDMEDIFAGLGHFGRDLPSIEAPPQEKPEDSNRRGGSSRNSLRDFMLKNPDDSASNSPSVAPRDVDPSSPGGPSAPRSPFHHRTPFSRFKDIWSDGPRQREEEKKEDRVEERRTVRDGQGNEETTVIRSGGPGGQEGPHDEPASPTPGGRGPYSDMQDEFSMFTKFFGGFGR
ncbi:hypothetical protein PDJAM_G00180100 [Pangasius djambal]|uniref:Uncharacterized protein n=1 Tax=Pangasius djambal TaxID=1691987 RepID=A0ACC5ZQA9_9TELE|nr:hypothetical protein [Pangasius djambal]